MNYLCNTCGTRLDNSMRVCPKCGAINIHSDSVNELIENQKKANKNIKRFNDKFYLVGIIIGIMIFIVSFSILLSGNTIAFISSVCGGLIVFLSILGIVKKEPVAKGIFIAGIIAIFNLLFTSILWNIF